MRAPQENETVNSDTRAEEPAQEPPSPEEPEALVEEAHEDVLEEAAEDHDTLPAETYPTIEQYK